MDYEKLSQDSKDYVDRYIRGKKKTREQALQEALVKECIKVYEKAYEEAKKNGCI